MSSERARRANSRETAVEKNYRRKTESEIIILTKKKSETKLLNVFWFTKEENKTIRKMPLKSIKNGMKDIKYL